MSARSSLAIVLLGAGCIGDDPPNATLADLPELVLGIQVFAATDVGATRGLITLHYDEDAFRDSHDYACATLDAYDVSFGGARIESRFAGGDLDEGVGCMEPSIDISIERLGETPLSALSLGDNTLTVEATFASNSFLPHVPTLRSPSEWHFRGGDTVVIGWSHPADFARADLSPYTFMFDTGPVEKRHIEPIDAEFSGDEIRFTVPSPPPMVGNVFIAAHLGYVGGDASSCTGARSCVFSLATGYDHSVVIED